MILKYNRKHFFMFKKIFICLALLGSVNLLPSLTPCSGYSQEITSQIEQGFNFEQELKEFLTHVNQNSPNFSEETAGRVQRLSEQAQSFTAKMTSVEQQLEQYQNSQRMCDFSILTSQTSTISEDIVKLRQETEALKLFFALAGPSQTK